MEKKEKMQTTDKQEKAELSEHAPIACSLHPPNATQPAGAW
jgi:hypothetical protein